MWGVELAVMFVMIAVNCVFAAYEIALASIATPRLQRLAEEGRPGAGVALYMKENMEASLAVVQLGITLVGAIAAAVGGAGAEEKLAPVFQQRLRLSAGAAEVLAIALVVLPLTVVTIIFGELIPKVFALRNAEWVCLRLSPLMRGFAFAVWPAVWLFEAVVTGIMAWGERRWQPPAGGKTEAAELQDLRATASLARALRLIGQREEGIILGAAGLPSRPVREIMLPAEHIAMLGLSATPAEALVSAHLDMHTRFPVTERPGDPQAIIGYVNVKDVIAHLRLSPEDRSVRAVVRAIPSLAEHRPIAQCLEQLMRDRTHIALVRSAAGRVIGMITLEDILEELVGDIQDEYDRLPVHLTASGAGWVSGGGVGLARLKEQTGIDLTADGPAQEARTLSEWVTGHLGQPVKGGEVIERGGARVVVRKVRRQKVLEAQVTRLARPPG